MCDVRYVVLLLVLHAFHGRITIPWLPHLVYPLTDGHLGYFHFLAVMNRAAMNYKFCVDICFHFS